MATSKQNDGGAAEVQANVDKAEEQGFQGTAVDPTPRENYTLQGVVDGKPTPETDKDAAAAAREASGR